MHAQSKFKQQPVSYLTKSKYLYHSLSNVQFVICLGFHVLSLVALKGWIDNFNGPSGVFIAVSENFGSLML